MRSRMDRYYSKPEQKELRTNKNEELYNTVYNMEPLNVVGTIDNVSEINLEELGEAFKSREDYRKLKGYKEIINKPESSVEETFTKELDFENKLYDINSVLEKARTERGISEEQDKYRKLRNTQYNILNNLNIKDPEEVKEEPNNEDKLRELIHTITMKKSEVETMMKRSKDENLLDDLLPSENTVVTEAASLTVEETVEVEEKEDVDKSFYTSAYNFTEEDFEDPNKPAPKAKSSGIIVKVLLFIAIMIITTVILFVINYFFDINIF